MMYSPPKRPSLPLQNSSTARITTVQSRPPSARSILSASSLSEGCSIRRKQLKGEAARVPTSGSKASRKELHIKANNERPINGRSVANIAPSSRSVPTRTLLTSKPRAATVTSRPVSWATRRPLTPGSTPRAVAPNDTASQKEVSSGQKLGPENWTPITARKITICTPPPKLKVYRQKRASVLPRDDGLSLFGPVQAPESEIYEDVFYKFRSNSSLRLSHGRTKLVLPHVSPMRTCTRSESPEPVQDDRGARNTVSPPSRHLKIRARAASKNVSWDPSVIVIGSKVGSNKEDSIEKSLERVQVNVADGQIPAREPDVKDCVETIKQWGKADKSKLASLIEALKEMELNSQDITEVATNTGGVDIHNDEVTIMTVQSLNPRVPDFQLPQIAKTKEKPGKIQEPKRSSHINLDSDQPSESDSNKENIPEPSLEPQTNLRANAIHRAKKRTIAILDDHDLPGREVNSFDQWYGELQLREFAKKYPLTGSKAPAVRRSSARNYAKTLTSLGGTRCVSSSGSKTSSLVKEFKSDARGKKGNDGSGVKEAEIERLDGKRNAATASGRADCSSRPENPRPRRRVKPLVMDPSARLNAAVIQHRLEILLLKEKERKALEGLPEQLTVLPCHSISSATFGHWGWSGNLFAGGLESEYGGNGGQVWVPSERLRL